MSGGAPANTSSTTTINQSPWQNATYRALALGTPDNLGPVAQQLKIGQQLTQDWMDVQSGRNPGLYYGMPDASPEQVAAAKAGRNVGFAEGRGAPPTEYSTKPMQLPAEGEQSAETQTAAQGGIMNLRGFADGGLTKSEQQWLKTKQKQIDAGTLTGKNKERAQNLQQKQQAYTAEQNRKISSRPYSLADTANKTAFLDPATGQNMLADAQLAYQRARDLGTPEQMQMATNAYQSALAGLQNTAGYTPQQVSADQVKAAQIARGDIRDVAAQQAQVERMTGARNVRGATMSGPQSWTQQGVAAQYMNPYTQNVLNQELFEANRQAQQRENQQRSQSAQQKAFGGTRAALQESEGRRNLGYLLSDIEAKGLQQAYGQGMQQFQQEQGLGQQAKQVNVGSTNQANLANQLYGTGGFQAQAANQAAQNQAYNNYVQQQLTAQGMNQGMDWNTASQNATMQMQAMLANQQANLQAGLANQSAGLQANQQRIGAYGQMSGIGQGLGGLGATQSQINLNNLAALGQSATAQTQYAQGALDRQTQNAMNYFNLPTTFNAAGINAINAQPVSGGSSTSQQGYGQAGWFGHAKGGKVKGAFGK